MNNPTTTTSSPVRWVATTALAVVTLMAFGGAAESQFDTDAHPAPASVSDHDSSEGSGPTALPTPAADHIGPAEAVSADESAQTIVVVEYYMHPFLPNECFWYCTSIFCPCAEIWIFF